MVENGGIKMKETKEERQENLKECIEILERVVIILEDNPNIKDISDFYLSRDLIPDVFWIHEYLKELKKEVLK